MTINLSATFPDNALLKKFLNRLNLIFPVDNSTKIIPVNDQDDEIILEIVNVPKELEKDIQDLVMKCGGRNRLG